MASSKPNILILMADQMTPGALPVYGHRITRTPNLERLADDGVVFDPDQLYDVTNDPNELRNLAGNAEFADLVAQFPREVRARWDLPALHGRVLASQRRHRFHFQAESLGTHRAWDYQPFQDASRRYMRNHLELDTLEAMARFPRVDLNE